MYGVCVRNRQPMKAWYDNRGISGHEETSSISLEALIMFFLLCLRMCVYTLFSWNR